MMDEIIINPSDSPPESKSDTANLYDDSPLRCLTCNVGLYYGGRGRKPKYCDEHKPNKGATSGKAPGMSNLQTAVGDLYRTIAIGVNLVDSYDAMVIASNADKMAESWITLAKTDPKVRKFLQKITTGSGWGAVMMAHTLVAFPIMVHHNMLPENLRERVTPNAERV